MGSTSGPRSGGAARRVPSSPVHTLPGVALDDGFGEAFAPQIAVDSDGDAVFVWTDFDGANPRIRASSLSAGGVFGPARYLSLPGEDASEPQVAVDLDGDAVFTWVRFDNGVNRTQSRAMTAAGALGPVQNLSPAGVATECPQVAVDSDGDSMISWTAEQGTPIRPFTIQARARNGAGGLSAVQTISLPLTDLSCSDVGVDSGGDAIFTWSRLQDGDFRAESRSRSAAGTLGSRQTLSPPGGRRLLPPGRRRCRRRRGVRLDSRRGWVRGRGPGSGPVGCRCAELDPDDSHR